MMQRSPLHQPAPHESGTLHVTGEARYIDDIPEPKGLLVAWCVMSPHARARILTRDATEARNMEGVHAVLFSSDIPGSPFIGPIIHDEPFLALDEVHYVGQPVALVVGESYEACRLAAAKVQVTYEELTPLFGIQAAIQADSFHTPPHVIRRGKPEETLAGAPVRVTGEVGSGGQDHFYLETQAALVIPGERDTWQVFSSTQHPTEAQKMVAAALGVSSAAVTVEVPRMGGGFGGKESQSTTYACLAAVAAWHTRRPVKVWLNRRHDMEQTGKRHPFWSSYDAGLDERGRLLAIKVHIFSDGGWTIDLSGPVLDRALFHLDNAYFLPEVHLEGRVCRTNVASNTAFRGFGGPQGMMVIEEVLNRAAERLKLDPAEIRRRNYYVTPDRDRAPYGQQIKHIRLQRIDSELMSSSDYAARRKAAESFNRQSTHVKRGVGFQPIKFGISFTKSLLNQAGALVHIYTDGTVQLNHGGTEMGQGLHTKMLAVCAHELGIPLSQIRMMNTATDKVPNTSATAASSGSDLNGQAVRDACVALRARMAPIAARMLGASDPDSAEVRFEEGRVFVPNEPDHAIAFSKVAVECWVNQVGLSAVGFYRTPGIAYDEKKGQGTPFYYYAFGAAVTEVEVCGLTGEHRILRVDILHDVGDSLVPTIDLGQVEGGYIQGVGWLTGEEVLFRPNGALLTHGPSTYKIPSLGDAPEDFRVALLDEAPQPGVIGGSKAVGEPPFMLAISVVTALRHAIGAFGPVGHEVDLSLPSTPEAILRSVIAQKAKGGQPTQRSGAGVASTG